MERYLKTLKQTVIVWLVLGLVTAICVEVLPKPVEAWLEVLLLLVMIFLPLGIFFYCLKIPVYLARDSIFGDKPSSATVLTWQKVLNFVAFATAFLLASAGYAYILFKFIIPYIRENNVW